MYNYNHSKSEVYFTSTQQWVKNLYLWKDMNNGLYYRGWICDRAAKISVYTATSVCASKSCSQIALTSCTHSNQHDVSVQQTLTIRHISGLAHSTHLWNDPEFLTCQLTEKELLKNREIGCVSFVILENNSLGKWPILFIPGRSCRYMFNNPINKLQKEKLRTTERAIYFNVFQVWFAFHFY